MMHPSITEMRRVDTTEDVESTITQHEGSQSEAGYEQLGPNTRLRSKFVQQNLRLSLAVRTDARSHQ